MQIQKFVPISKIDEEKQMVYGYASTPELDSQGEIVTIEALTKALPSYMKFPTIREMHQPKSIGVTKEAEIRDGGLWIGAKIVNKDAWALVKEGAYRAFSIGGNARQTIKNRITELSLLEISLVDVPANKGAVISIWKRQKSAFGVSVFADLMEHIQSCQMIFEPKTKEYKKLSRMLEQIKSMVASQAEEKEDSLYLSDNPDFLKRTIKNLESMDTKGKPVAEIFRKEVLQKVKDELKKVEEEEVEVEAVEETPTEQTPTEPEDKEETDEEKSEEITLQKLEAANQKLSKQEEVVKEDSVRKIALQTADLVVKLAEQMSQMQDEISKLKDLPLATKAKSSFVTKGQDPVEAPKDDKVSLRKEAIEKRMKEIADIRDQQPAHEFAKTGLSNEYFRLNDELKTLK